MDMRSSISLVFCFILSFTLVACSTVTVETANPISRVAYVSGSYDKLCHSYRGVTALTNKSNDAVDFDLSGIASRAFNDYFDSVGIEFEEVLLPSLKSPEELGKVSSWTDAFLFDDKYSSEFVRMTSNFDVVIVSNTRMRGQIGCKGASLFVTTTPYGNLAMMLGPMFIMVEGGTTDYLARMGLGGGSGQLPSSTIKELSTVDMKAIEVGAYEMFFRKVSRAFKL
jgi:hypothetical protein